MIKPLFCSSCGFRLKSISGKYAARGGCFCKPSQCGCVPVDLRGVVVKWPLDAFIPARTNRKSIGRSAGSKKINQRVLGRLIKKCGLVLHF
jgi:hypothetical protein